jgi:hypothetical protein
MASKLAERTFRLDLSRTPIMQLQHTNGFFMTRSQKVTIQLVHTALDLTASNDRHTYRHLAPSAVQSCYPIVTLDCFLTFWAFTVTITFNPVMCHHLCYKIWLLLPHKCDIRQMAKNARKQFVLHTWEVFLDLTYVVIQLVGARWTHLSWTVYLQTELK